MKLINSTVKFVITYYKLTLLLIILLTGIMGYFYLLQKQENSIESFFFKDDPILLQYQEFREKVGSDELAVVAFEKENLFTNENIQLIRDLTNALKTTNGIMRVHSLTEIEEMVITDDEISLKKLIPEGILSKEELNHIKQKISALKGHNHLASKTKNGTATIIISELEQLDDEEQTQTIDYIINITEKITNNRTKLYHSGIPIILAEMDKLTKKDIGTMTPLVGLAIFVIIILLFRNITLSILAMLTLGITQAWGIGLFVMCGEELSFITTVLPAILVALAIADSVHLISHFLDEIQDDISNYANAVAISTKAIWMPCLLTTLTTSVGFFSFVVSPLRPVFLLGIFASIGVLFAFIIDVTFLPAMLILMRERITKALSKRNTEKEKSKPNQFFTKLIVKTGNFSTTHVAGLTLTFLIIISLALFGMSKLVFETNPLKHLPDSNKIKSDLVFLENNFGGIVPLLIIIKSKGKLDFTQPEAIKLVDMIQKDIMKKYPEYVTDSFSIADFVKEANKAFNNNDDRFYTIPANQTDILDFYEMNIYPDLLKRLISRDRREVYITLMGLASSGSTEEWQAIKTDKALQNYINNKLGDSVSVTETGLSELTIQMEENLKKSQMRSIIIAFFLIFIMMLFVCKNIKLAIIGMIPNVFPIIVTLGVMGWLNIRLNEATIMIAAVTLGIAVDDTVHFITWYIRSSSPDIDIRTALMKAFKSVGKPIVITTILLSISFSIMILGSFKPVQTYGILTAFSMVAALIGDFFFLPALILIFRPKVAPEKDAGVKQKLRHKTLLESESVG